MPTPEPDRTPAPDPLAAVAALPGVEQACADARRAVDALLSHRALRRSFGPVVVECSLREAVAAAALEEAPSPAWDLDAVRAAVRSGAPLPGAGHARDALSGALRVSAGLGALVGVWERSPRQALARLHVLAAAGVVGEGALGRPRPSPEVATRLDQLARVATTPTAAPAVVVSAVVQGELRALRPFGWGSTLVALAAARLALHARGLDPRGVTVPAWGHLEAGGADGEALDGYRAGTADGVARWVVHCARAVVAGAREGTAVAETLARA